MATWCDKSTEMAIPSQPSNLKQQSPDAKMEGEPAHDYGLWLCFLRSVTSGPCSVKELLTILHGSFLRGGVKKLRKVVPYSV